MQAFTDIQSKSLSAQIYSQLRYQLMAARMQPGVRLKIRELAQSLGTSETPVREALLQLVRDGALEMKPGYYIRVRRLTLNEYLETREIRLMLEPHAAVKALPHVDKAFIEQLEKVHETLIRAEADKDYPAALLANYEFHFLIYRRSGMPQLIEILERLWIQIGPLLNYLYPFGHPSYDGPHQHLHILEALRKRDAEALAEAFRADLIEGGRAFVRYLESIEPEATQ
ncbi:GntR family transcriptional regulator [Tianweitania sp. BSSL-BM11]|uniref:GntR family transcriptional regulator n=1 Tax=Tianweitania aestuarii TaxID=2814886 RepID=A0ABS5RSA5_9HYPH|nr:GntR family transcriptional regulator [Tianweitania aestuarii]MBS9719690.1 GntR family transcriptional regulator [Tianweitania aestuarii]